MILHAVDFAEFVMRKVEAVARDTLRAAGKLCRRAGTQRRLHTTRSKLILRVA